MENNRKRGSEHRDTVFDYEGNQRSWRKTLTENRNQTQYTRFFYILLTQCHVLQSVCVFHELQSVCVFLAIEIRDEETDHYSPTLIKLLITVTVYVLQSVRVFCY